jgi:hypothetical protein
MVVEVSQIAEYDRNGGVLGRVQRSLSGRVPLWTVRVESQCGVEGRHRS